jgi:hypothetical protein
VRSAKILLGLVIVVAAGAVGWLLTSPRPSELPAPQSTAPLRQSLTRPQGLLTPPKSATTGTASTGSSSPAAARPRDSEVDGDLDELAKELGLRPEQREHVRMILLESERELDRRMRALPPRPASSPDLEAMERASDEVARETDARIREALDPEQRKLFDRRLAESERR